MVDDDASVQVSSRLCIYVFWVCVCMFNMSVKLNQIMLMGPSTPIQAYMGSSPLVKRALRSLLEENLIYCNAPLSFN